MIETVFIQPDLSQAEARVVAYLSGATKLIELFNDPSKSIHMENARAILGYYPKKDSPDYILAKKCVHAANYRISAGFFSTVAAVPKAKATELLEAYHWQYPQIREWHNWVRDTIGNSGILRTPFGRERIFATARAELLLTGRISNDAWKDAVSYVPQATVPDVTNRGMVRLWERTPYVHFHQQGHDSFLCSVPTELLGEAASSLVEALTEAMEVTDIRGVKRSLVIPVDVAWGFSWGAMKGWKGEQVANKEEWLKWVEEKGIKADLKESLLA